MNTYFVKSETKRYWNGDTQTLWYGHKNGWYASGTTSKSRDESIRLLCEKYGIISASVSVR